jgi:peptide chain release factor 1
VPPTERRGRVHTSTVKVAVLNGVDSTPRDLDPRDLRVDWYSGSGAGGSHRNKHQNSCRITHVPTDIVRKAETRSRENSYRCAVLAVMEALAERVANERRRTENTVRRGQVGSGMRGDKRRTYRFQDDTVVDHVTCKSARCSDVMRGAVDDL